MQKNQLLYGVIGALIGGLVVWLLAASSFSRSMMGMQRQQNNNSSQQNSSMIGDMDRMFIQGMIPHHQSAIDMAKLALEKSQRQEIKNLATNIVKTQSEEITKMKDWYKNWYRTDVTADTMEGNNMMGSIMRRSAMDMSTLAGAADFDKDFLSQMTSHHQMAVMMAQMMLSGTTRPEMKRLGQDIIEAQTKEIKQMQAWYDTWY